MESKLFLNQTCKNENGKDHFNRQVKSQISRLTSLNVTVDFSLYSNPGLTKLGQKVV